MEFNNIFDCRHFSLEGLNVEFDIDVRFLILMHKCKSECQKPNVEKEKLGCFVWEETYTILT